MRVKRANRQGRFSAAIVLAAGLSGWLSPGIGAAAQVRPVGVSEPAPFYFPNAFADPYTGQKTGWVVPGSTRQPVHGMWQNQEHAIVKRGDGRWLVAAMEMNRIYFQSPGAQYVEAYYFLEYDDGILSGAAVPTAQAGYWRGNTPDAHPFVWAPYIIYDTGIYHLFYTALDDAQPANLACYLATSATGEADPTAWVQYDPDPGTTAIEPLFRSSDSIKDFHVIRASTPDGPRHYCYYIANPSIPDPDNPGENVVIAEVRLRVSDSLTQWSDKAEIRVFRRLNIGICPKEHLAVDYENPEIIQYDDGAFYLFVSRHGQIPADYLTNPDWKPIPLATEVYWSPDGKDFPVENQLPNLRSPSGREINAAEIVRDGSRWLATHAQPSNRIENYELDTPQPNPTEHSETLTRVVSSFLEPENSLQILEFAWEPISDAAGAWVLYP